MELCNILKYDRSLYPSKAVFFYKTDASDFVPLEAVVNKIRGQKAGFTEGFTPKFTPKNLAPHDLAFSNIVTREECHVPPNVEHLYCRFSLRIQPHSLQPSGCSDSGVFNTLQAIAKTFKDKGGYCELARRYCKNLLLGTWLWDNQNSGHTRIEVKTTTGSVYLIPNTQLLTWDSQWPEGETLALDQLSQEIERALTEPSVFWCADVTAKIATAFCQEVFPSQAFLDNQEKAEAISGKGSIAKVFAKVKCSDGKEAVSFNCVKIGAALQLIDNWCFDDSTKRLRVHEYGADKQSGIAIRAADSDMNFYAILANAEQHLAELETLVGEQAEITPDIYYMMAVLIKGGMFQKKDEKKGA